MFERKWGKKPEGVFYDSYKLAKSFRDGLQKALWVHKDNPNKEYLREALRKMNADPKSRDYSKKLETMSGLSEKTVMHSEINL